MFLFSIVFHSGDIIQHNRNIFGKLDVYFPSKLNFIKDYGKFDYPDFRPFSTAKNNFQFYGRKYSL